MKETNICCKYSPQIDEGIIHDYVSGRLPKERNQDIETHFKLCRECAEKMIGIYFTARFVYDSEENIMRENLFQPQNISYAFDIPGRKERRKKRKEQLEYVNEVVNKISNLHGISDLHTATDLPG